MDTCPLGWAIMWNIVQHDSSEGPSRMGPQSLSAVTSTIKFAVLVFPPFLCHISQSPTLCLWGYLLVISYFTPFPPPPWGNSRMRQYQSPGLRSNEEYIYTPSPSFLFLTVNLMLFNCVSELFYFYFSRRLIKENHKSLAKVWCSIAFCFYFLRLLCNIIAEVWTIFS